MFVFKCLFVTGLDEQAESHLNRLFSKPPHLLINTCLEIKRWLGPIEYPAFTAFKEELIERIKFKLNGYPKPVCFEENKLCKLCKKLDEFVQDMTTLDFKIVRKAAIGSFLKL